MFVDFNILNQLGSPSINSNVFANRPSAGQVGRLFVSTDTFEIYRDNGTGWDLIGGPGSSTVTGSGAAGQVTYWTGTNSVGGENNLWWDAANNRFGINTNTPTAAAEIVQTDGVALYSNFTTNAGSGTGTTALWAINTTNSSGFAAVIEEKTPNTTAGQYPLAIKHSLSSGTAGVGMGTGLHFQLPDDAGTFKTTQLTIETTDAAAATYKTRYRFNVQNNGTGTPVAYINATGLGLFTATPGAALDIHSTGVIAQFNTTSATGNTYISFQRTGTGVWRIGDTYNGGNNFFELHNMVLGVDAVEFEAATNKSTFQAQQTYSTGLARGNYFDYNLSVAAGGTFSSPNAISSLGASLDLTLLGNATIPSGARSGLDAYNSIAFTGTGTLTQNQGTQIRAYSNLTTGWAFGGSATGTITHLAGVRVLFPDNTGSSIAVTNNYGLLINDQTPNTGTVTYTNRWGIYQEGASDLNYMASNLMLGSTVNNGNRLQVTGNSSLTGNVDIVNGSLNFGGNGTFSSTDPSIYRTTGNNLIFAVNSATALTIDNNRAATFTNTLTANNNINSLMAATTAIPTIYAENNVGSITRLRTFGTSAAGTLFGITAAGWSSFDTNNGLGLLFGTTDTAPIVIGTSNTERVRITSAGLVGINTINPSASLDVNGNILISGTSNGYAYQNFGANSGYGWQLGKADNSGGVATSNGFYLYDLTNNATRLNITTGGNFLIGTTTDSGQKLQVNGQVLSSSTGFQFPAFSGGGNWQMGSDNAVGTGMYIYNSVNGYNLILAENGNLTVKGGYISANPNGGTAATWKLGSYKAASVTLNTSNYIEVDIGGTLYKLAVVT